MSAYLLDTNILSELVRPKPELRVTNFFKAQPDLWLSVISMHEFAYGIERASDPVRKAKLETWVQNISLQFEARIIPLSQKIAEQAGRMRASSDLQGRPSDPLDAMIGATALLNGLTLVTRNTKDFETFGIDLVNPWER
jgi:toxin FitB